MPTWMSKFIEEATPMVELEPAAVALGRAIAEELQSADDLGEKLGKISADIITFKAEIEKALTPAAAA